MNASPRVLAAKTQVFRPPRPLPPSSSPFLPSTVMISPSYTSSESTAAIHLTFWASSPLGRSGRKLVATVRTGSVCEWLEAQVSLWCGLLSLRSTLTGTIPAQRL